jgi:4-amino-4-deoxy-L-arabinose transferase-like glycosyltransferase
MWTEKILVLLRKPQLSSKNVIIIGLLVATFLVQAFLRKAPFQSDESIYTYSAYAISRGIAPYSGIQLAQPPLMYLALAFFIDLVGPNLSFLTLAGSFIVLLTNVLVFIIAKRLRFFSSNFVFPVLSIVIYSFITFDNSFTSILEILLTFFILLCTAIYVLFVLNNGKRNRSALFLVGILMGLSLMIKYSSLVFSITLFLYHCIRLIWKKEYKRAFTDGITLCLGAAIPIAISIALVAFVWGSFRQFYLQSIYWQTVRWPTPLDQRFFNVLFYVAKFFPLLILSGIGTFLMYKKAKSLQTLFFPIIFVLNIVGLTSFFSTFFLHYLYYLSPILALLSAAGLSGVVNFIRHTTARPRRLPREMAKFLVLVTVITIAIEVGAQIFIVRNSLDDSTHLRIGQYTSQITTPDEKIWTSEGAIAFYAQRLIVAANSSDWPIQCAFSDIFAYDFGTYMGASMKDYKNGVVSPEQFVESWEANKIKVIIIIRGTSWVPYPDGLLWSGFQNFTGVSEYVQEKYVLNQTFASADGSHAYEVWLRK